MAQSVPRIQTASGVQSPAGEPRNVALDGFRGLMTVFVLISHYLGEVAHGWSAFEVGWIAVTAFFVLSGFLVGRLIIEKQDRANFYTVFYVRRFCRTLPVYVVCVLVVFCAIQLTSRAAWLDAGVTFPLWSYLTFTQNAFMTATGSIGAHWLAPTWTLAVEEQFYLIVPALFLVTPRKYLLAVLCLGLALTVEFRAVVVLSGTMPQMARLALLPGVADTLICGLIAAVLWKTDGIDWQRYDFALRVVPVVMLVATLLLKLADGKTGHAFDVFSGLFVSVAAASFLLSLARGAPEARRFTSPVLCFFGNTSYTVYLTHLTVLGLVHGLILGAKPDIATPVQLALTLAAIPLAVLVGWAGTRIVEQPITAYGRSWAWSAERRGVRRVSTSAGSERVPSPA